MKRVLACVVLACAACSVVPELRQTNQTFYGGQGFMGANYLTFEHPFTDTAAADAQKRAEFQCVQRKQVAIKVNSTCSLAKCTTNFQCMDSADAALFAPENTKK